MPPAAFVPSDSLKSSPFSRFLSETILGLKQANAEGVCGGFVGTKPVDTTSGRRRGGPKEVPGCVLFHFGGGCTQCGWG
jgi:hypothetical protein